VCYCRFCGNFGGSHGVLEEEGIDVERVLREGNTKEA